MQGGRTYYGPMFLICHRFLWLGRHMSSPKSWFFLSLAACFLISAAWAAALTDTASFRVTRVRGKVTVTSKVSGMTRSPPFVAKSRPTL